MEGRSTAGDGHWPVLRTEVWRRFVPIRCCGIGWPQEPEWTGHACCSKSFKLGSMFKLGAFKAGSNRFEHRGARGLGILCKTSIPAGRSEEDHGTCRLRPNDASAREKARQAQTLRFFRLLRLLGPPQSSNPQRLLAASESEPTLATDSVLGARHQLPSVADTTKRVDRNSLDALTANFGEHVATASACIASTRIHQHHPSTVKPVEAQGRCENPGKRTDHLPDFRVRNRIHL
jgi:hypothetical protein